MKQFEIKDAIGKCVTVNGFGDLAIDPEMKRLIYNKVVLTLEKQCKSGLLYLRENKKLAHAVPMTNVDLYPAGDTVLHETPARPAFMNLPDVKSLAERIRTALDHQEIGEILREENFKRVLQMFLDGIDFIVEGDVDHYEHSMPLELLKNGHHIDTRAEAERLAAAITFSGRALAEVKAVKLVESSEVTVDELHVNIVKKADRKVHYNDAEEVLFEIAEAAKEKK